MSLFQIDENTYPFLQCIQIVKKSKGGRVGRDGSVLFAQNYTFCSVFASRTSSLSMVSLLDKVAHG